MKAASINDLKKELATLQVGELAELCLRMAKYKKENKELLTYLLVWTGNEAGYVQEVKEEMSRLFEEMNASTMYYAKKTIRKILRRMNTYIRYSGDAATEAELRITFCTLVQKTGIDIKGSTILNNLYQRQLNRIENAMEKLHEDLQYDLRKELNKLV